MLPPNALQSVREQRCCCFEESCFKKPGVEGLVKPHQLGRRRQRLCGGRFATGGVMVILLFIPRLRCVGQAPRFHFPCVVGHVSVRKDTRATLVRLCELTDGLAEAEST